MYKIGGTFNGTGADIYICLGFVPDAVRVMNSDINTWAEVYWDKTFRSLDAPEGYSIAALDNVLALATIGTGVRRYFGGETLTATTAGTVTYGEGVYLKRDDANYRRYTNFATGAVGDAENTDIITWTLDTAAANTGHFNDDVVGTYIGEGSILVVDVGVGKQLYTTSLTACAAAAGSAANAVTLVDPIPSGEVRFIGPKWSYRPMVAGEVTKAGFKIEYAFTNNDTISFWAEKWD